MPASLSKGMSSRGRRGAWWRSGDDNRHRQAAWAELSMAPRPREGSGLWACGSLCCQEIRSLFLLVTLWAWECLWKGSASHCLTLSPGQKKNVFLHCSLWLKHKLLSELLLVKALFIFLRRKNLIFQKCNLPPPLSEVPGNNYVHLCENWFFFLSKPMPSGLARAATHSWNASVCLQQYYQLLKDAYFCFFSPGIIYLGVGMGWLWLAAVCPQRCSITLPQQDKGR